MFWLQENLILMKEMVKKCSTDQRFILKEITSLKIQTLVGTRSLCKRTQKKYKTEIWLSILIETFNMQMVCEA